MNVRSTRVLVVGMLWVAGLFAADPVGASPAPWSFKPIVRPVPPAPSPAHRKWVQNEIDQFVLERAAEHGLSPSEAADRRTLVRRLFLDLTGLPPGVEDIDRFMGDRSVDAYQRLVDRLLASPHYGEHWGRFWLDAARYADTNGFEKDRPRPMWPYRDWVIRAFNDDMPFDRFTIEQLAGDLLPNGDISAKVATGFLRNSMVNEEGGVEPEQFRIEGIIDRVDAVGKAFLGLTTACAQCHDHKFDPLAQEEYFKLFAFLNNDDEAVMEVTDDAVTKRRAETHAQAQQLRQDALEAIDKRSVQELGLVPWRMAAWESEMRALPRGWSTVTGATIFGSFGQKFEILEDGSFLSKGDIFNESTYTVETKVSARGITGFRLEVMTHPSLFYGGPGRIDEGAALLSEFQVTAAPAGHPEQARPLKFVRATADAQTERYPAAQTIDGDNQTGWSTDVGGGRSHEARVLVFEAGEPLGFAGGTELKFSLMQRAGKRMGMGRFRLSLTTDAGPLRADPLTPAARRALAVPVAKRSEAERLTLFRAYHFSDPGLDELNRDIASAYEKWPTSPLTLVLRQREPLRATHMFHRGDYRKPGKAVQPGVPAALHAFPADAPPNRLGLARWITSPDNPLTPRVIVNRVWQRLFAQGLVTTPEDFGMRADPPSHPGLLDWLASDFRDHRSWKKLIRTIVLSGTYRQSSRATAKALQLDPGNVWLARGVRQRVEAESIRDIAMAASGLLDEKVGGESVFPRIPDGLINTAFGNQESVWRVGEGKYRRGMYVFFKRAAPYPSLTVFDAPGAETACVRRARSNTPLQALTTLNDPVFVEAAQAMGLRVWREGGKSDADRITYAHRLATGRPPAPAEMKTLGDFVRKQRRHFTGNTARAVLIAAADPTNPPEGMDLHQVAPWTLLSRLLLNLDETITKE